MATYFISDLHLDETRPLVTRAFFNWLDGISKQADALYILGDFFEVWLGDDDNSPLNQEIIRHLKDFSDTGRPLFIMHGNRDFLIGERFNAMTGATLLPDPSIITLYGESVLLMHGDSLCTRDTAYMAFRQQQARNREWQQQILALSLPERRRIAQEMREQSKSMNSLKAEDIMDVTPEEVIRVMAQHNVQRLIHGHTHRPARHDLNIDGRVGERIVLGDWGQSGWCLSVSDEGYLLKDWQLTA